MEALLLKSEGLSHKQIGQIVGVSQSKLRTYFDQYQRGGIEELKRLNFYSPKSELEEYDSIIEEEFKNNPPATLKEAAARIKELTGIERSTVQVGKYLKKGFIRRKAAPIPAKADTEKQKLFLVQELTPRIEEAKQGKRQLLFVDASHFVMMAFRVFMEYN